MRIEYDSGLVEQAVNRAVYGNARLEQELHAQIDRLYDLPASGGRNASFVRTYAALFERLDLDRALPSLLDERPCIAAAVDTCLVGPARGVPQESAELFVRPEARRASLGDPGLRDPVLRAPVLILQVSPATLAHPELMARRMRPELVHIADMVDPAFRYRRQEIEGLPARRNLVKDRYRVLWDIYVHGRLEREGHGEAAIRSSLLAMLARVFGIHSDRDASRAFALLFDTTALTHEQLFAWATDPDRFRNPESNRRSVRAGEPGANCPLCGFSTFDWFAFDADANAGLAPTIELHYPGWHPGRGACRQCAEIYASPSSVIP